PLTTHELPPGSSSSETRLWIYSSRCTPKLSSNPEDFSHAALPDPPVAVAGEFPRDADREFRLACHLGHLRRPRFPRPHRNYRSRGAAGAGPGRHHAPVGARFLASNRTLAKSIERSAGLRGPGALPFRAGSTAALRASGPRRQYVRQFPDRL